MAIDEKYRDDPSLLTGAYFEFTSGTIYKQHQQGQVLWVEEAPNAAGKTGRIVVHTLNGHDEKWQTHWSYFHEHAIIIANLAKGA